MDARFTPEYERAMARLMPDRPAKEATPVAENTAAATLAKYGVRVTPADFNFAAGAVLVVGLFAVAAYALSRRS